MSPLFFIFTVLSAFFLSILGAPLPSESPQLLEKRAYYGEGTWFRDGLGACGWENSDSDSIIALSVGMYGSGGSCGQWIAVTNTATGATAYGMVADKCQSCGEDDLDMSMGLFEQLGNLSAGVLAISWNFT